MFHGQTKCKSARLPRRYVGGTLNLSFYVLCMWNVSGLYARADNPGNPSVATAVAMTHFVVARGGPPVATGGEKFHAVYKILQKS